MTEISREAFIEYLHDALSHLYNADQLRKSPLAGLFGVANRFDTSSVLRKILSDAIESLKPPSSEPDASKAWRTYESLYCCFLQQLNQQVVADQLCISSRQLRREQRNALDHLADLLWQKYNLGDPSSAARETGSGETLEPITPLVSELGWLVETQPFKPTRLNEEVQAAVAVFQPLLQKNRVTLRSQVPEELPGLAAHAMALNQILVSLLGIAIHKAGTGVVIIAARKLPLSIELAIQVEPEEQHEENNTETSTNLQIASELTQISGGRLHVSAAGDPFLIRLVLPVLEQFPVLVIDDNDDSLHLMKRYAEGTRYQLICTRDTDAVLELVEAFRPRIIVLDIMMPKENGWIVLARLRQHRLAVTTPVIICTILPQEKLALSLGASAFLKKPVSRQAFLQVLDQQAALQEPEYS